MTLIPESKQSREQLRKSPLDVTVLLAGMPKVGKTTLAGSWPAETTLIVDTQNGTAFLDGEHYVTHVQDWPTFVELIDELIATAGERGIRTVILDLADDLWRFCDVHHAGKNAVSAGATDDYQKSLRTAKTIWATELGRLIGSGLGVWFMTRVKEKQDGKLTRYAPLLEKEALSYVQSVCEVILLAETLGVERQLHTAPTAKFEAGSRFPLPDPLPMDAKVLYRAMGETLQAGVARDLGRDEPGDTGEAVATDEPVEAGEAVAA